ncbi:MAG: UvrD-helicase domain-containing protein [Actinomycetota bacterium]
MVFGAPGSGKTEVIIEAARSRIRAGQNPNSLLIITYGREHASGIARCCCS